MNYQTYQPHPDLSSIIQCYWTLEVPHNIDAEKQRIVPDGSIEMAFILGDDIKRFTSENEFVLQPRALVVGQINQPFYIQPVGEVNTFAIRFYPFGFGNFMNRDIKDLLNREAPISEIFKKEDANNLESLIIEASSTKKRIEIVEEFLLNQLSKASLIDKVVSSTVNDIIESKGGLAINELLSKHGFNRRSLERKFSKQVGLSPKQLGKVIRLQAALKLLIESDAKNLTQVAYASDYYDQAHFIKDFQEFTGTNPKNFLESKELELSTLFYTLK